MNRDVTQLSSDVMACLENYKWPGNVRELANALEKAVALCPGDVITRDLIGDICNNETTSDRDEKIPLSEWSLEDIEKAHVQRVLESTHWHKGRTCDILGVSRPRLRRMIKHFDLIPPEGTHADMEDEDEIDSQSNSHSKKSNTNDNK